jgi:molecular chaperone DnaK
VTASDRPVIGIDLGTTFSVVAYLDHAGIPQTIQNLEGELSTPSVVFFDTAEVVVGREAVKAAIYEPDAAAQFVKRDMGKQLYHKPLRGIQLPPEVIQAAILRKLRHDAQLKLPEVREAVITVPAFFNEPRRKATMDAGRLAGLEVLDIINEPTAAAIAYGVKASFVSAGGRAREREAVLVYDLGGGTLDLTLMELDGCTYTALATDGDMHLGGIDWDRRIAEFVAERFQQQHGVDLRQDVVAMQILLREAEDAKRALSSRLHTTLRFAHQGRSLQLALTRQEFEAMTGDLVQRTVFTVTKLLRDARRRWSDLSRFLLVGGSTRMPMIQRALEQESGMKVDRSLSPDEAIAHGAALYAGLLQRGGAAADRSLAVKNVNSHDLGVLAVEKATGMSRRQVMIPRNTTLPARSKSRFVTHHDRQRTVVVNVIEGGDDSGKNSTPIGKCVVSGLPAKLPAGTSVVVQFYYSANGRLSVKASLPEIGVEASTAIERASGMTDDMLRLWQARLDAGQYLVGAEPEPPPAPAPGKPARKASRPASATSLPAADEDFIGPQLPADDEDSEVFSDLDF